MDNKKLSFQDIERAIEAFPPEEQSKLLRRLPQLLELQNGDISLLKMAESSFDFWNNTDDAAYDTVV